MLHSDRSSPSPTPAPVHPSAIHAHWRPISRMPAYKLVVDRIQEQIVSGALGVGDRLPPERELAVRLDVSRPAIREGLRMLEALGALKMGVGTGPDSGTIVASRPIEALVRLLQIHQGLSNLSIAEIAEVGIMLEALSAREAAVNASDADHSRMRRLLQEMAASRMSPEAAHECDVALHLHLAEACGNRLIAGMVAAIRGAVREGILDAYETSGDWPGISESLSVEHEEILAAVRAGDPALAADRAEKHARDFFACLKLP